MTQSPRATLRLLDRVQMTAADRVRARAALERAEAIADALYRWTEAARAGVEFTRRTARAQARRLRARLAKAA